MLDMLKESRALNWNRELQERVANPLCPEATGSVLIIIPGSSGDVALATSVVRYIKERNPECKVSFGVKRSNLPLLRMCPGVDEAVEVPTRPLSVIPSRQNYLAEYAGKAEVVIYPICIFEDVGLLRGYNFLETIWLLSGIPNGMPEIPAALWLVPPAGPHIANQVLRRSLGPEAASRLVVRAAQNPAKILGQVTRQRKFRNLGWKNTHRMLQHASFVRKLSAQETFPQADKQFVIVSSEANAVPPPPKGLFEKVISYLRSQGRIVLQNVLDPARAVPGTVPLVCSYEEFLCLREAGIPFVGWRSGLCDVAAASQTPMSVLYPTSMEGCSIGLQANCESPFKSFGFRSMSIATECTDIICDSDLDLDMRRLEAILA